MSLGTEFTLSMTYYKKKSGFCDMCHRIIVPEDIPSYSITVPVSMLGSLARGLLTPSSCHIVFFNVDTVSYQSIPYHLRDERMRLW